MKIVVVVLAAFVFALSVSTGAVMAAEQTPDDAGPMVQAFGEETATGADDGR